MSKIKVRLIKRGTLNVKLKPQNGIKAKTDTTYLYDPTLVAGWVDLAEDWAIKTDGKVEEEGVGIDYSAKAYAIGGTGTQTNNAKYYAEQASDSATSASNSANTATTQAGIATTQAGISTTQAVLASGYATSASNSASSASTSASNSQVWAEGTDVQVAALGGTHSAKEWANLVSTSLDDYTKTSDLAAVALSNSYNDLDDKPTIGNATLTIQRNSTTVDTFTANATTNKTINITVPTKTSDITNDSGFINGIDSSDVTTALGYTPYNSTNPAGYTSNVGTVTSVNSTSPDGNGNVSISVGDTLPPQTGNSGKFLTTNGSATSWATVDALPIQTGQSGKYLTTNGSSASWATVDSLPSQAGNSGKFLTTNGTTASWGTATKVTIRRFS